MKTRSSCLFVFSLLLVTACEDLEDNVGFESSSGFGQEQDGTQQILINLGKTATSSIIINYIVGGSASLDGDYKILSNTNYSLSTMALVVKEGESTGVFSFALIDDLLPEPGKEVIYVEITNISDPELNSTLQHKQFTFEIQDNDSPPADGLQADLTWSVGEGISINAVNFDLYVARHVQITNNEVTDFELVDQLSSTNPSGFESIFLNKETDDEKYYLIIRFVEGTMNAEVYLQLSQGNSYGFASGRVASSSLGNDLYYGPITKNGNTFTFR